MAEVSSTGSKVAVGSEGLGSGSPKDSSAELGMVAEMGGGMLGRMGTGLGIAGATRCQTF